MSIDSQHICLTTLLSAAIAQHTGLIIDALANRGLAVVSNAIPALARQALRDDLHATALRPAGIGRANSARHNAQVRNDSIAWMDGSTPAQNAWLTAMEQLRCAINRDLFLGLFDYESHFAH